MAVEEELRGVRVHLVVDEVQKQAEEVELEAGMVQRIAKGEMRL